MVKFHVTPHPGEAQVLQGQNLARVLYGVTAEGGGETVPIFLGVVMDQSGSMQGIKLNAAKDALQRLLRRVPPSDNVVVHITLFNDTADELAQAMTGRQLAHNLDYLSNSIQNINAGGATSLGSGLRVALEASTPYSVYERRVLMITDGKQEGTLPVSDAYNAAADLARAGI